MMKRLQGLAERICWDIGAIQQAPGSGRTLPGLRRWDNIKCLSTTLTPRPLPCFLTLSQPLVLTCWTKEFTFQHSSSLISFLFPLCPLSNFKGGLCFIKKKKCCKSIVEQTTKRTLYITANHFANNASVFLYNLRLTFLSIHLSKIWKPIGAHLGTYLMCVICQSVILSLM